MRTGSSFVDPRTGFLAGPWAECVAWADAGASLSDGASDACAAKLGAGAAACDAPGEQAACVEPLAAGFHRMMSPRAGAGGDAAHPAHDLRGLASSGLHAAQQRDNARRPTTKRARADAAEDVSGRDARRRLLGGGGDDPFEGWVSSPPPGTPENSPFPPPSPPAPPPPTEEYPAVELFTDMCLIPGVTWRQAFDTCDENRKHYGGPPTDAQIHYDFHRDMLCDVPGNENPAAFSPRRGPQVAFRIERAVVNCRVQPKPNKPLYELEVAGVMLPKRGKYGASDAQGEILVRAKSDEPVRLGGCKITFKVSGSTMVRLHPKNATQTPQEDDYRPRSVAGTLACSAVRADTMPIMWKNLGVVGTSATVEFEGAPIGVHLRDAVADRKSVV